MAVTAQFSDIPNIGRARISGALAPNTARDGSGTEGVNIFLAFTAGVNGSRVDRVIVNAAGTLAATTAEVWLVSLFLVRMEQINVYGVNGR